MVVTLHKCEICLTTYKKLVLAKACEAMGVPDIVYQRGQKYAMANDDLLRTIEIVDYKIIRKRGKHIYLYQVKWGSRLRWFEEKRIEKYISDNQWVPI